MRNSIIYILLLNLFFLQHTLANSVRQEVIDRVEKIRAIIPTNDKDKLSSYNKLLDENWKFFTENKHNVLPHLRKLIETEIRSSNANSMVLLDIGSFIYLSGANTDKNIGADALLKINPKGEIINRNFMQFFRFSHMVATSHGKKVLPLLDEVFLTTDQSVFIPQHVLTLDATLMSIFLYGVISDEIDIHLAKLLDEPKKRLRILEVLNWLGSVNSLTRVNRLLKNKIDDAAFQRILGINMRVGGKAGKHAMLSLDAKNLSNNLRQNISNIQGNIKKQSYENIYEQIKKMSEGAENVNDKELINRMDAMIENGRLDNKTSALSVFNSKIDKNILLSKLKKQRSHILRRLSDEALSEVKVLNLMINGLQFKN